MHFPDQSAGDRLFAVSMRADRPPEFASLANGGQPVKLEVATTG